MNLISNSFVNNRHFEVAVIFPLVSNYITEEAGCSLRAVVCACVRKGAV